MAVLGRKYIEEMIAHAREEAPYEACGLLLGQEGRAVRLYRAANADKSPITYQLEPEEQFRIFMEMEEKGLDLWGIYHSHPTSPAYPSARDIKRAYFPESLYLIISLAGREPEVRAFLIVEGEVREEELLIEGAHG